MFISLIELKSFPQQWTNSHFVKTEQINSKVKVMEKVPISYTLGYVVELM